MKIGFTGTQVGMTKRQRMAFCMLIAGHSIDHDSALEFHHGDCIGADAQAHEVVDRLGHKIVIHPPLDIRKAANCVGDDVWALVPQLYLTRNKDIVDATELLIAAPKGPEELRSGTWSTVRYARRQGKQLQIIMPDGAVTP